MPAPSSVRSSRDGSPRLRAAPDEVTIVDWPLRDQPLVSSFALTLAAGATWLAVWATGNVAAGGAIGVLLILTLWRTWLPVRYQIGSGGVVQGVVGWRRRIAWPAIRSYEIRGDGVLLLPDVAVAPLSPLRGLYLRWGNQREAVMAQLDFHLTGRSRAAVGSAHGEAAGKPQTTDSVH